MQCAIVWTKIRGGLGCTKNIAYIYVCMHAKFKPNSTSRYCRRGFANRREPHIHAQLHQPAIRNCCSFTITITTVSQPASRPSVALHPHSLNVILWIPNPPHPCMHTKYLPIHRNCIVMVVWCRINERDEKKRFCISFRSGADSNELRVVLGQTNYGVTSRHSQPHCCCGYGPSPEKSAVSRPECVPVFLSSRVRLSQPHKSQTDGSLIMMMVTKK